MYIFCILFEQLLVESGFATLQYKVNDQLVAEQLKLLF